MTNKSNHKPIEEWFQDLKEPYKSKALKYAEYYGTSTKKVPSLYEALKQGFVWQFTKENNDHPGYWRSLAQRILIKENKNK